MVSKILTPMNHREIEYRAKKLSRGAIPDSFASMVSPLLEWLDEIGKRVFDNDLIMDYGTDCLRLYLLFEKTPKEQDAPGYDSWQEGALEGIYKFLGRYRRMILAADEWDRRGNYTEEALPTESISRLNRALEVADNKIKKCISRGNTLSNRHNIVSALMELLNIYQKELKIGKIITSLHEQVIETAVPNGKTNSDINTYIRQEENAIRNPAVVPLCQGFVIRMAPYAPDLSRVLWDILYDIVL